MVILRVFVATISCLIASLASAATVSLSQNVGPPTTPFTLSGTGFAANAIVDVYFDVTQMAFGATNGSGAFSLPLKVPASATPGAHPVTVLPHVGAGAGAQKQFTVQTNWLDWHRDGAGTGWNRTENMLSSNTVGNLDVTWLPAPRNLGVLSTPIIAGSNLYFTAQDGRLRGFSRVTRKALFTNAAPISGLLPPAYENGLVITAGAGKLYARNYLTGALVWHATLPSGVGAPVVSNGVVYVVARGNAKAGVFAFATNCKTGGAQCAPLWRAAVGSTSGYYIPEASVAVGMGRVFAVIEDTLYSFFVGCGTGGATCSPEYSRSGIAAGTAPVTSNGYVYTTTTASTVLALPAKCIACSPAWSGTLSVASYRSVAVAGNQVFVVSNNVLQVFPNGCGAATCAEQWHTTAGDGPLSSPTVANGLVYVVGPTETFAYPVVCYTGCPSVWQAGVGGVYSNAPYASLAIADGVVYAPDATGLVVFSLDSSSQALARASGVPRVDMSRLRPANEFAAAERRLEEELRRLRH